MSLVVYKNSTVGVGTDDFWTSPTSTTGETIPESKFVGLANQGATCYLNGLIQTLFMTPEFRRAVFSWHYSAEKDGSEDLCIPLQLQKLFGKLQLCKQRVVDTVALTTSFGWEGFEVFQQQDVQELTRVLFDALEETFKGTAAENAIDDLFAGELVDYLRCIDVDYQSERVDKFLDFSLAIVPFGSENAMKTLTECIEMFLRPEILDGENKYYAEKYDQRVDAIKGLKFKTLPQIMSIQLKRFVYDFSGDYVVQKKLNDQVKFPFVLDMNKYVATKKRRREEHEQSEGEGEAEAEEVANEEFEAFLREQMAKLKHATLDNNNNNNNNSESNNNHHSYYESENLYDDDPGVPALVSIDENEYQPGIVYPETEREQEKERDSERDSDGVSYASLSREEIAQLVATRGEHVYELYAVLVHSGAINGGHYFAYVKDVLATDKWFEFNDSLVSPIDEQTVRLAWGAAPLPSYHHNNKSNAPYNTAWRPQRTSSTSAYMLLYRRAAGPSHSDTAPQTVPDELIPSYIREAVEREEALERERQREEEERRNRLSLRVSHENKEHIVVCSRKDSLRALLSKVWHQLELSACCGESPAPRFDLFRLCQRNAHTKLVQAVFSVSQEEDAAAATQGAEEEEKTLETLCFSEYKSYVVETRTQDEDEWEEFIRDGFSVAVEVLDELTNTFSAPHSVRLSPQCTLGELKALLVKKHVVSWCAEEMQLLRISFVGYTDAKAELLCNGVDAAVVKSDYGVYDGVRLFLEKKEMEKESESEGESERKSFAPRWKSLSLFIEIRNRTQLRIVFSPNGESESSRASSTASSPLPPSLSLSPPPNTLTDTERETPTTETERVEQHHLLSADARWTVSALRERVAALCGLPVDETRMFRGSRAGAEIKNGESNLSMLGVCYAGSVSTIFVTRGALAPPGFFQLSLSLLCGGSGGESESECFVPGIVQLPYTAETLWEQEQRLAWDENRCFAEDESSSVSLSPVPALPLTAEESEKIRRGEALGYSACVPCEAQPEEYTVDEPAEGEGEGEDDLSQRGQCDDSLSVDALDDLLDTLDNNDHENESDAAPAFCYEREFPALQRCADDDVSLSVSAAETPLSENNIAAATAAAVLCEDVETESLDDVTPSDFGERMLRNKADKTQFQTIPGLPPIFANNEMQVSELREKVRDALVKCGSISSDVSLARIRLRDRYASVCGKILRDGKTLSKSGVYLTDHKALAVQVLADEETLPEDSSGDVVVDVQRFIRSDWSLSHKVEVLIPGAWTVKEVARGLAAMFDIPFTALRVLIVPRETEFYQFELAEQSPPHNYGRSWMDPTQEDKPMSYVSHGMRLVEGDLLVVQDASEPLGALCPADRRSVEIVRVSQQSTSTGSGTAAVSWAMDDIASATKPTWSSGYTNMYGQYWGSSSYGTGVGTGAVSSSTASSSAPQGIRIKTHKDRLKESEDKERKTDSECTTPLPSESNANDEREFARQGGPALFSDINI